MLNDFFLLAQVTDSAPFKFVAFIAVFLLGIGLPFYLGKVIANDCECPITVGELA